LGRIEKGLLYIVDRAKDIIIRGGENISCSAVENAVYNEKRILDW
jgi:acyl-CoA synthetase (AMP-forming)/AMP-acid ligase II